MEDRWNLKAAIYLIIYGCCLVLSGCSEQQSPDLIKKGSIATPHEFFDQRKVNLGNISAIVEVDGTEIPVTRTESDWRAEINVQPGTTVSITINWFENFQKSTMLQLATWSSVETISSNRVISLDRNQYDTNFDFDSDGDTNLQERNNDSNPVDPSSNSTTLPSNNVNVIVPRTTPSRAPKIDGSYDKAEYDEQNAKFTDRNGDTLKIANLMLNEGTADVLPSRSNGNTEFKWFAIHDGEALYIGAVGELVNLATPHHDSGEEIWKDDSMDVFIDVGNDKLSSFGADDFHFIIPLQTTTGAVNKSGENARLFVGSNSAFYNENNIEFSTCDCQAGQYLWEVRIPFAEFGLTPGTAFGIDVHFNIDHDGGDRDTKWGWYHPSGTDTSWFNPSSFGTAYLQ